MREQTVCDVVPCTNLVAVFLSQVEHCRSHAVGSGEVVLVHASDWDRPPRGCLRTSLNTCWQRVQRFSLKGMRNRPLTKSLPDSLAEIASWEGPSRRGVGGRALTGHTRGSGAPVEGVLCISLTFLDRSLTPTPATISFSLLLPAPGSLGSPLSCALGRPEGGSSLGRPTSGNWEAFVREGSCFPTSENCSQSLSLECGLGICVAN